MDQYGNYVIQHLMEKGQERDKRTIVNAVRGHVLQYSRHKFASNVVEKCVAFGSVADREALIGEVLEVDPSGDPLTFPLLLMMKDQFANYVVQKILDLVEGAQRDLLLALIRPHLVALRKFTYGKHILAKVEKLIALTGDAGAPSPSPSGPVPPALLPSGGVGSSSPVFSLPKQQRRASGR